MSKLIRLSFTLLLFSFTLSLASIINLQSVSACSCIQQTTSEQVQFSDFVFIGQISSVETNSSNDFSPEDLVANVSVTENIKGTDLPSTIEINTASNSAACGINLEANTERLFFISQTEDGSYSTGLCNGGVEITPADLEQANYIEQVRVASSSL
ncbi:MAG: hypothetical protein Q9M91_02420 [Candidatus Dojkabacteria bacterium]|nr:hypothetical protein [Candidatus Dojkabacteria bacterium]MDQ7020680.1 hypothetical protein [Candidatus Dojkabacteria bacterium]